jgi:hypothetical protein
MIELHLAAQQNPTLARSNAHLQLADAVTDLPYIGAAVTQDQSAPGLRFQIAGGQGHGRNSHPGGLL